VAGSLQDLTGQQVADLSGEFLGVGEACAPGHPIGAIGVVQHIFGGSPEGGTQRIQQLRYVFAGHALTPEGVAAKQFTDFRQT
jgi:hypothetical protein